MTDKPGAVSANAFAEMALARANPSEVNSPGASLPETNASEANPLGARPPQATLQVHGMDIHAVAPDWAPLTLAEVNTLLLRYPALGAVHELLWHSPRPFSAGAIALTDAGQIFIKRHDSRVRDVDGLTEEHGFIAHLRAAGLPVVEVVQDRDGASAVAGADSIYEVHRVAPGVDVYREALSWSPFVSCAHAFAAGRALAQLHHAAAAYSAPARRARILVGSFSIFNSAEPLAAMQRFVEARPALAEYLAGRAWREQVSETLLPFYRKFQPFIGWLVPLWTHNDWHASNLLWSDAGPQASVHSVLDFGLSDRTCAVHDIATAIERNIVEWLALAADGGNHHEQIHFDLLDAMLDGYETLRGLDPLESAALPALLPLVHAEFALSEVAYFHGVVHSAENAALAYDGYFLGHAAWFNTAAGQALLDHLRRRAQRTAGARAP
jgi:Ser/Thr protein kinase RdoA (MazF antagonist)